MFALDPDNRAPGHPANRPSHPSGFARSPLCSGYLPGPGQVVRPQLRIITTSTKTDPHCPLPARHPALIKTAPLLFVAKYESTSLPASIMLHDHHQAMRIESLDSTSHDPALIPTPAGRHRRHSKGSGHRRRLSDKFKNLFSALHLKRDDRIPFVQLDPDENLARKVQPTRPHRSPGTASFLVTRHLASDPELPHTARSSSTGFSIASRPGFAEKMRPYPGLSPYAMEVSHFSNPTTMSNSPASTSTRSVSTGDIVEKSSFDLSYREGAMEESGPNLRLRRIRSMPNLG